jgi:predicted nucleic-acid-binding protein
MTAVDTNVVVRLLTEDHTKQTAAAKAIFRSGPIWIGRTVLLETAWVLGSLYEFEESDIREAFTKLLGLKNVSSEDKPSLAVALTLAAHGVGLADAIHLSARPPGAPFVSFDRAFVRRAKRAGVAAISGA